MSHRGHLGAGTKGSRLARLFFVLVVCVVVGVLAACGAVSEKAESDPSDEAAAHPAVAVGAACSSCKESKHDYVHAAPFESTNCVQCHALGSWSRISFAHVDPAFDNGMHLVIGCSYCHTSETPLPSPDCSTCHAPTHVVVKPCATCHTPWSWRLTQPLPVGHVSLGGKHSVLECYSCHQGGRAFTQPARCAYCHGKRHGGLTDCSRCHDPAVGWRPAVNFDHNDYYRLSGRHKRLACTKCHPKYRFAGTVTACVSCHGTKHGGLTRCASCHTTSSFKPSTFRHSRVWTLTGRHARLSCRRCHPGLRYAQAIGDPDSCSSCHGSKHGGLTACSKCHTTAGFKPSTFKHSSVWALTGRHRYVPCSSCHPQSAYARVIGSPSRCTNCHGIAHGNQTDCAKCHATAGFVPAKQIAHPVSPALSGEHAVRSCRLCHPAVNFTVAPTPCLACHTAPHVGPTDCLRCHRPTVWTDVHFIHNEIGYHTGVPYETACGYCHTTGDYTEYRCDQCHFPF